MVQSSAVVIGLAMTLAQTHLIGIDDAMYWIYGANIGTTATALLASVGTNYVGRQVAWAHFFYKVGSVLIFLGFSKAFADWMLVVDPIESRAIANAHTIFNVISAIIYLPFLSIGVKWVERMFPPREDEKEFGTKYINKESRVAFTIAFAQSTREALRMGDIVLSMVQDSIKLFESINPDLIEDLHARDNKVDILFREIKAFLVRFSDESGHLNAQVLELLAFITDLENAADIVDKNLVELSEKKQALQLEFSHQGWIELQELHRTVCETLTAALSCVQVQDRSLATEVIAKKRQLRGLERKMRESHLERLNRGLRESINTSSIHLELLSDWRRIASLFSNQAYALLNEERVTNGH
jgi:phosphate:Na+ symporter